MSSLRSRLGWGETRAASDFLSPDTDLLEAIGAELAAGSTILGASLNSSRALTYAPVYACVRLLAESMASTPLHVFADGETPGDRIRVRPKDDTRASLLRQKPNPEMTAFELIERTMGQILTQGNAYWWKITNFAGQVVELWPLDPSSTAPIRQKNASGKIERFYKTYLPDGTPQVFLEEEIIHFKAFALGEMGISPLGVLRQAAGIGVKAEEYAHRFFENDARPGGVLSTDKVMKNEDKQRLMRQFRTGHQGVRKSQLLAILDGGMTWSSVNLPAGDAQFIETRKFQMAEVARVFNVPRHKIGDTEGNVTFASIEMLDLGFQRDTLRPWFERFEQTIQAGLFGLPGDLQVERKAQFITQSHLSATTKERYEAFAQALGGGATPGWMTVNEIRQLDNLPAIEGGDILFVPSNVMPATQMLAGGNKRMRSALALGEMLRLEALADDLELEEDSVAD